MKVDIFYWFVKSTCIWG